MTIELVRRPGQTATDLGRLETLLSVRGIAVSTTPSYALAGLVPPEKMKGLHAAATLLVSAIQQRSRILIIGDYDADGATSVALMIEGLGLLGASHVEYLVPNRFEFGYGLSPELVDLALTQRPDLIITVDQGIVSFEGVAAAKAAGVRVVVTDHHLPGQGLPPADAIVNPNQNDCEFPSKALAGVGVAFYLLIKTRALLAAARSEGNDRVNLAQLLDLVALGTVADLVPLDDNNRRLVQSGINRMRAGQARPGIQALIEISGIDHRVLTTTQLAFNVAPRLNAAGRLEDMSLGVACLLSTIDGARASAARLDALNLERREIEHSMQTQAAELLLDRDRAQDSAQFGISLFDSRWHEGVVGILASRVRAQCARPVFAFAEASNGLLKGSGRSIEGLQLRDLLAEIDAARQGLLQKFGGHAMAAGVTIRQEDFSEFATQFDLHAKKHLLGHDLNEHILSEGLVPSFDLAWVAGLVRDHPWGQGFPEPIFDEGLEIVEQRVLKGGHLKLKLLSVRFSGLLEGIFFNQDRVIDRRNVRFAFKLDVNRYRGVDRVQLLIVHCWP